MGAISDTRDKALAAELAMVERHVLLGERHIARQLEIVANFHRKGFPAGQAEELLALLKQMQILHIAHRERLRNSI